MKNFIEIERKFLLKRFPMLIYHEHFQIEQWYSQNNIRYRKQYNYENHEIKFFKTQKTNIAKGVNKEIEEILTSEQFEKLELSTFKYIKKDRYVFKQDNHRFEVNDFDGIIVVEIELKDINENFSFPKEIKDLIVLEITGIKEFNNYNLAE